MVNHPNRSKKTHAILSTSTGGRGFIVEDRQPLRSRYVITAAHCLPHLPPAHGMSYMHERTYATLLGTLGSKQQKVWAECLFVDPVADIAVLCQPDDNELSDQADAYDRLCRSQAAIGGRRAPAGSEDPGQVTIARWEVVRLHRSA